MKLVKMSLAAAVLLGASAFAIDNVKVNGDAKLYYGTSNAGNNDLFDKGSETEALVLGEGSYADAALRIGATGDLLKGVSFGVTGYAVSTLGLENNLVSQTWTGAHGATIGTGSSFGEAVDGAQVNDASWMGELWMAATMGKTTVKAGRMELDTPLAFTEKWSVVPNTFEGAVILNQDIPDTTLVGAWIGKGNGGANTTTVTTVNDTTLHGALVPAGSNVPVFVGIDGGVVGLDGKFNTFGNSGAYAAAIINNSYKPATVQAWYYNVSNVADAIWLQADINCQLVKGVKIGAQYAEIDPKATGVADSEAYAFKLGYEGIENLKASVAYSKADEQNVVYVGNLATGSQESKLYTETFWNRGWVGLADAQSWNAKLSYDVKDVAKVCASYTNVEVDAINEELDEAVLSVSKSFGPLDTKVAYVNTDIKGEKSVDTINVYLTLNF